MLTSALVVGAQNQQGVPAATWQASSAEAADAGDAGAAELLTRAGYGLLFRAAYAVLPGEAASQTVAGDQAPRGGPAPLGASLLRPSGAALPSPVRRTIPTATLGVLWAAYDMAARSVSPMCHLPTTLLAAIGQVESGSLAGRSLDANHRVVPPVLGPVLSGGRYAAIRDTDGGRWDGDSVWDRAVGPMQFIPGTWSRWGSDGNGDGIADPQNLDDAALSAARYLCAGGRDLSRPADLRAAILSYNRSTSYVEAVLGLMRTIRPGADIPVLSTRTAASQSPTSTAPPTSTTTPSPTSAGPTATSIAPSTSATPPPTSTTPSTSTTPLSSTTSGSSATSSAPDPTTTSTPPSPTSSSSGTTGTGTAQEGSEETTTATGTGSTTGTTSGTTSGTQN